MNSRIAPGRRLAVALEHLFARDLRPVRAVAPADEDDLLAPAGLLHPGGPRRAVQHAEIGRVDAGRLRCPCRRADLGGELLLLCRPSCRPRNSDRPTNDWQPAGVPLGLHAPGNVTVLADLSAERRRSRCALFLSSFRAPSAWLRSAHASKVDATARRVLGPEPIHFPNGKSARRRRSRAAASTARELRPHSVPGSSFPASTARRRRPRAARQALPRRRARPARSTTRRARSGAWSCISTSRRRSRRSPRCRTRRPHVDEAAGRRLTWWMFEMEDRKQRAETDAHAAKRDGHDEDRAEGERAHQNGRPRAGGSTPR